MADIFGDAQLPPWLKQGPFDIVDRGQQAFTHSEAAATNLRELSMREQQQNALLPLMQQERQNQLQSAALDLTAKQFQTQNVLNSKEGIVALAAAASKITNWAAPDALTPVFETVKKYPQIPFTPQGQALLNQSEAQHNAALGADARLQGVQMNADAKIQAMQLRTDELGNRYNQILEQKGKAEADNFALRTQKMQQDKELSMMKMAHQADLPGFDVLNRSQEALWGQEIKKIYADPTLSTQQAELAGERAWQSFVDRHGIKPKAGAPAPGTTPAAQTPPVAAAAASNSPAAPKTQADFEALKPGALYINPADGKTYRKK